MREILFRGKRKDNGEWVHGFLYVTHNGEYEIGAYDPKTNIERMTSVVDSETVGQYTGLTDKNGRKVFEGDIVVFGERTYRIHYECGSFALHDKQGLMIIKIGGTNDYCYPLMDLYTECCWENDCAYDIEVIGNIHDTQNC